MYLLYFNVILYTYCSKRYYLFKFRQSIVIVSSVPTFMTSPVRRLMFNCTHLTFHECSYFFIESYQDSDSLHLIVLMLLILLNLKSINVSIVYIQYLFALQYSYTLAQSNLVLAITVTQ